jgi:hypothetical protein
MALNPIVQRVLANLAAGEGGPDQGPRMAQQQQSLMNQFVNQSPTMGGTTTDPVGGQFWQSTGAAGGPQSFWQKVGNGVDLDKILATIRAKESGGNYGAKNPVSSASGAYQFINSTWNNYGGYKYAYQAPKAVQDAKAKEHIQSILKKYGNTLEAVPAAWYTGTYKGKGKLNYNPGGPGNPLTVQQYVDAWIKQYLSMK